MNNFRLETNYLCHSVCYFIFWNFLVYIYVYIYIYIYIYISFIFWPCVLYALKLCSFNILHMLISFILVVYFSHYSLLDNDTVWDFSEEGAASIFKVTELCLSSLASACEHTLCRNTEDYNHIALITDIKQCDVIVSFWYTGPFCIWQLIICHFSLLLYCRCGLW